jgi:hypothetical protein
VGVSLFGLLVAVAVLAPSFLLLFFPVRGGMPVSAVPGSLIWVERAGQALCLVVPVITETGSLSWWWLPAVAIAVAAYYALWGRYLTGGRRSADLYRPLWKLPVPMAVLPVVAFLATGAWLGNPWIMAAAIVLAVGHIPASLIIARSSAADR